MPDQTYRETAERLGTLWQSHRWCAQDLIVRLEEMDSGDKIKLTGIERDIIICALADKIEPPLKD